MNWHPEDARWMEMALRVGARHLGRTWPNPSVGAVVVKDGQVLAVAVTAPGGRPHAETQALAEAGAAAKGATLYATLEPCSHTGRTGPCTDTILRTGISRVVIAIGDPDARVAGQGIEALRAAGVVVALAPLTFAAAASEQHRGFFRNRREGMPYVALKLATSLEGAVATASGESQWITGEAARAHAQGLRVGYEAWMTGISTILHDDPRLTCRAPGLEAASPIRVVADSQFRFPENAALMTDQSSPIWILTSTEALSKQTDKAERLKARGVELLPCRMEGERLDLADAMKRLGAKGVARVMIEAGPVLSTAALEAGLVERIYWYRAPMLLGRGARLAVQPQLSPLLAQLPRWMCESRQVLGADSLEIYVPNEGARA